MRESCYFTDFKTYTLHNVEVITFLIRQNEFFNLQYEISSPKEYFKLRGGTYLSFLCSHPHTEVVIISTNRNAKQSERVESKPNVWYEFKILNKACNCETSVELYFYNRTKPEGLALNGLLTSKMFSDVNILTRDGKKFEVHKCIISFKSEVFRAHLLHDTKESSTNKIESMFEAEVIEELLRYLYTEQVSNLHIISERLLEAADFYNLEDLKNICELYLCKHLTVDNVIHMYKLADLYKTHVLKRCSMRLIYIHRGTILESEAWAEFNCNQLIKDLATYLLQLL